MRGRLLLRASLGLVSLGLASLALAPEWPGFWVLLTSSGLLLLLAYGPSKIRADLASLIRPPRRAGFLRLIGCLLAIIVLALVGLIGRRLPMLNLAGPLQASFNPQTFELLKKLEHPVSLEAFVSDARRETRVRWLLDQYARASRLISASVSRAEAKADLGGESIALSRPESVVVESGPFREVVSPISQAAIDASIRRLISPNRLVLNLMGDGEKSALDSSPMGLSLWAASLEKSKIHLKDCLWAQPALPPEAWAAHALVLAGPRRPLGEEREAALMDYLSKGGKLLIFQDPMVVGFRSAALKELGLSLPWGMVVDPDATWAGTEDFFVISRNFPAHPLTMGLTQPVVWPLAGAVAAVDKTASQSEAIVLSDKEIEAGGLSNQEIEDDSLSSHEIEDDSLSSHEIEVDSLSSHETEAGGPSDPHGETGSSKEASLSHTWSVAMSSDAAWLETDGSSLRDRSHRYQAGVDQPGPVTLASATTLAGGGRLVLAADADLAANGFISYAGNLAFLDSALYWLLGAQEELQPGFEVHWLDLTHSRARALFWIPTVIWPVLVFLAWRFYYARRRRGA